MYDCNDLRLLNYVYNCFYIVMIVFVCGYVIMKYVVNSKIIKVFIYILFYEVIEWNI